jgi:hypothetical protein
MHAGFRDTRAARARATKTYIPVIDTSKFAFFDREKTVFDRYFQSHSKPE